MTSPTGEIPDPADGAPDAPAQIGRYRLEELVGTGACATVHRAYDQRLGDTVAIKVLAGKYRSDPEARERFVAEGRALRQVASPNVIRVHDMGETDDHRPYLVLEYADRGTLARRVAEWAGPDGKAYSTTRADILLVARSLAEATGALHRVDLVHRDLSPGNILVRATPGSRKAPAPGSGAALTTGEVPRIEETLTASGAADAPVVQVGVPLVQPDEQLAVADLGLVKDLAGRSGGTVAAGTEAFRAPERRMEPGWIDARADLWALSAILVWLITGAPPEDDPDEVAPALATKGFTRPLADALARSLAAEPADRHPDVAGWLDDVEAALARPSSSPEGAAGEAGDQATSEAAGESAPLETVVRPTPPWRSRLPIPAGWGGTDFFRRPPPPPAGGIASPRPRRRRRTLSGALLFLLLGAAVGVGVMAFVTRDDGGSETVTRAADGEVTVVDNVGEASLAMVGPESVVVGDLATFKAEPEGLEDWVWVMPDGAMLASEATVSMRPSSPGQATVTLIGTTTTGERIELDHQVSVVD